MVKDCKKVIFMPEVDLQYSLFVTKEAVSVQMIPEHESSDKKNLLIEEKPIYQLKKGERVMLIHSPDHLLVSDDLGQFSTLVLSVFLRELVESYMWIYEPNPVLDVHDLHDASGFCSIADGAFKVRSFQPISTVSYYMSK